MTARILGLDHGDVRTGVAVSDGLGLTAQPKELVRERDMARAAARVAEIAGELEAAGVVVEVPGTASVTPEELMRVAARSES